MPRGWIPDRLRKKRRKPRNRIKSLLPKRRLKRRFFVGLISGLAGLLAGRRGHTGDLRLYQRGLGLADGRMWMPGTSPGTTPVRRLETIPGISTHLANAGVQPRPWLPRSLSPSWPGEATKLRFAPTSRPSTSFYVERSVLPARSSDRVFRGPTTSPRVPRPADKGRGCPGQARARRR